MQKLIFIIGKRKAGTTFLFHALAADFKPTVKDRSWPETQAMLEAFQRSGAQTGVIAKADAIYDVSGLIRTIEQSGFDIRNVLFVVLDRDPYQRFLSFLDHARKQVFMAIEKAKQGFDEEENQALIGFKTLQSKGLTIYAYDYSDIASQKIESLSGVPLRPVEKRANARGDVLPFFRLIAMFAERPWYQRIRQHAWMMALKDLYYAKLAKKRGRKNGSVRIAVLGSVAGPIDGQRRLTRIFVEKSSFSTHVIDYHDHRAVWGIFKIMLQFVRCCWIALSGQCDAVYLAISRTKFGLIRDTMLSAPFMMRHIPILSHVHGAEFDAFYYHDASLRALKAWQLNQISSHIFIDQSLLPDHTNRPRDAVVLRNPLPKFASDAALSKSKSDQEAPLSAGFISSFVPGKGLESYLTLARTLGDTFSYIVAGGAHAKHQAYGKALVDELSAERRIKYLGYLTDPTSFYAACDVVVFPTHYVSEAVPGVVLEALAFGCAVVLRRTNALPLVFQEAPILWFDDDEELIDVMRQLSRGDIADMRNQRGQRRAWVCNAFPSETDWVAAIETYLLNWHQREKPELSALSHASTAKNVDGQMTPSEDKMPTAIPNVRPNAPAEMDINPVREVP